MIARVRTLLWTLVESTSASSLVALRSTELDLFPIHVLLLRCPLVRSTLLVEVALRVVPLLVVVWPVRLLTEIAFPLLIVASLLATALALLLAAVSLLILTVPASSTVVVLALAIVVVALSAGRVLVISLHD